MNRLGINVELKNVPVLDPDLFPSYDSTVLSWKGPKSLWGSPWSERTARWPPVTPLFMAPLRWRRLTTTISSVL